MLVSDLLDADRLELLVLCVKTGFEPCTVLRVLADGAGIKDTASAQAALDDAQPTLCVFVIQIQLCA